jgi:hypothetical protein
LRVDYFDPQISREILDLCLPCEVPVRGWGGLSLERREAETKTYENYENVERVRLRVDWNNFSILFMFIGSSSFFFAPARELG